MAKSKSNKKTAIGVGVAVASTLAAAAGAYFLYGTKEGSKQRKKVKSWALKAKGEVLEKIEKLKDVSEDSYKDAVSSVLKKYEKLRSEHGDEIDLVKKELIGYWNHLKKHANSSHKTKGKSKK